MRHLRIVRDQPLTTNEKISAIFSHPALYELGRLVPAKSPVGRPAHHPGYLLLGYGVLARLYRSGIRVQTELSDASTWTVVQDAVATMAQARPELVDRLPGARPPSWESFRYARDRYLSDPEVLDQMQDLFTEFAVAQARELGLLNPTGPGSLSRPDRSRVVYGDGTVVRPLYRPPAATRTTSPGTGKTTITYLTPDGQPTQAPTRRFDPDAADYHGHTGSVHGQNFVALYARGDNAHQRVVLAVDRVPRPGLEADTAVKAIKRLHAVAGAGIQAIVYDGAMRGVHIDDLMTHQGLLVINKVHASAKTAARRGKHAATPRWFALGAWEHDAPDGPCTHTLGAIDGAVSEVGLDEAGQPVVLSRLDRRQVKRPRRASGKYHFSVAYEVPCPASPFLAWVTPHGEPGDTNHRRADAVRVIAEGEDDFTRLYGLRNDAESFNSQLKRSLLVDRAMSLGGQRQLLDVLCYGLLHNATNAYRAALAQPDTSATLTARAA
ncbi:hypothetical protein GCM10025782_20390 [Pedococcus ginsenosidimutans]|uniref:Transposase n=1 Tax=Pedococcus ginsenosidimutans TaxID=490570 RepID=A0ABP8Y6S4_9MICO